MDLSNHDPEDVSEVSEQYLGWVPNGFQRDAAVVLALSVLPGSQGGVVRALRNSSEKGSEQVPKQFRNNLMYVLKKLFKVFFQFVWDFLRLSWIFGIFWIFGILELR